AKGTRQEAQTEPAAFRRTSHSGCAWKHALGSDIPQRRTHLDVLRLGLATAALRAIPKGLWLPAQDWRATPTLGARSATALPLANNLRQPFVAFATKGCIALLHDSSMLPPCH